MDNLVFRGADNQALTNSLLVAEKFGKEHKRVMQDIREMGCSALFREHNFVLSSYLSRQNKETPMYVMTKDGFTLLVMSYTGEKAMKFKEDYIAAFNAMEKAIKEDYTRALSNMDQRIKVIEERRTCFEGLPSPAEELPKMSQRDCIRSLVNKIARATSTNQSNIWHKVYNHLYYRYHISIRSYKKKYPEENNLDIAERNGLLPRIYTIVSNMYDLIG
ncbi:Rha family transcriptional regulator [Bacteroides caccae]|jgi:phage regulatory protein, rha family|uniref:Rha family transcriptional regulator n=1 Tax=Bacteroides caccae TaxID=47678 RepID=UPI0022AADDF2|nr:Rha family transcriptional regulator [Bacteroides caccae]MCZ2726402.1 Rha family transcriptional regulator [Bacteroides caccae]